MAIIIILKLTLTNPFFPEVDDTPGPRPITMAEVLHR